DASETPSSGSRDVCRGYPFIRDPRTPKPSTARNDAAPGGGVGGGGGREGTDMVRQRTAGGGMGEGRLGRGLGAGGVVRVGGEQLDLVVHGGDRASEPGLRLGPVSTLPPVGTEGPAGGDLLELPRPAPFDPAAAEDQVVADVDPSLVGVGEDQADPELRAHE